MTDLKPAQESADDDAVEPAARTAAEETDAATAPIDGGSDTPVYAWAPAEPRARKRRTGLWIGLGAAAAAIGLVAASLFLIAPGTSVAGVMIGGMTPGGAADAIQQRLAQTTVVLTGDGAGAEITGADLGASVDARALADAEFADHPMWNPTTWYAASADAEVSLDPAVATEALRAALPDLYTDPVDATVAFDPASATYTATPAVLGTGVDLAVVQGALQQAFERGSSRVELAVAPSDVEAGIPTPVADETAARLNGMLDTVGFYVGEERTVPVDRAVAASWLTVTPGDGAFEITADAAAIQPLVDGLAAAVNRAPENRTVITNSSGEVLHEEAAGQSGRELGDTSGIASDFAAQLADGNAVFALPVTEVPVTTVSLARRIEVNLTRQTTTLFENGQAVNTYAISSGLPGTLTPTGDFRVFAHVRIQDMGCFPGAAYCTEDVPWVTYFAPNIAFHGTYWHNNFGTPMSHGCINMPVDVARYVYDWAPVGTEVSVFY